MKILVLMEHDNRTLKSANYHTLTAAQQLGNDIDVLMIGYQCETVIEEAQKLPGIKHILVANAKDYEHQLAENTSVLIAEIASTYSYVIASASTFGKNLLPRVAALMDVAMLSDVIQVVSPDTFVRPIYAGNVLATMQTQETVKVMTVRPTAFAPAVPVPHQQVTVETINNIIPNEHAQFKNQQLTVSSRPELTEAKIVISGGRGLKSAENFKLIEDIADRLGAAVGASRAAVDAGFAPNDYQVGQTGKIVAPDLYIAVGISGAIQHVAGMKDSKIIVAINNDPDAPIFQVADYILVGDLFVVLQQLYVILTSEARKDLH